MLAISCNEESEELKRLGEDEYYNTERPMELSSDEHDILEEFYGFMEGRWTGSYTQRECRGKGAESRGQERNKIKTAKVKTEITLNSDLGVKIRSDGEFSDKVSKLFTRGESR